VIRLAKLFKNYLIMGGIGSDFNISLTYSSLFPENDIVYHAWDIVSQNVLASVLVLAFTYAVLVVLLLDKVYDLRSGDWEGKG